MRIGRSIPSAALLSAVFLFCQGGTALAGPKGGGGGTGQGSAPSAPEFAGDTIRNRPCNWEIFLSSEDPDGDLLSFGLYDGKLPPGTAYSSKSDSIVGTKRCEIGTWTSRWYAFDNNGNTSGPSADLTLECREDNQNSPPAAPTFSGTFTQTAPCSFNMAVSATDTGSIPTIEFVSGDLPPGHVFTAGASPAYLSGTTSSIGTWSGTFRARDDRCREGDASTLTLTCNPPAVAPPPVDCSYWEEMYLSARPVEPNGAFPPECCYIFSSARARTMPEVCLDQLPN